MKNKNSSDWAVALTVVACSAVLFAALALALSGTMLGKPARTVRVNFHDVMGVTPGAQVKYGGAIAGKVAGIRMLSAEERLATSDPFNTVQVTLALNANVPPFPSDVSVSVAADTLLSDKLILIGGGSPATPPLADNAVVQGISPTTFDKLVREVDTTIESLREVLGGTKGETGDVFERVRALLLDTQALIAGANPVLQNAQSLISEARPVLQDAGGFAADARRLIADTKEPIARTIGRTEKAVGALEQLATRSNTFVANNEKKLTATISDFKVVGENLKVTSTYTKILTRNLALRPSHLVWASKPPTLPSELQILQSVKPIPAD